MSLPEEIVNVVRLSEVATITDSLHSTPAYSLIGYPMVRVTDVRDFYLETEASLKVSKEIYKEFTKRETPQQGDIIFTRVGSYGNSCLTLQDKNFCLGQNTALIRPHIDPHYLLFCLKSPFIKEQIESSVVGSTQKTISIKSIKDLLIPIHSKEEIASISQILSSLQSKIELNRKTNETLEEIAKALFKSWFVDFDPVRAKVEGRPTGLPAEISDLFPDSFEDSELGEIPSGWRVMELGMVSTFLNGYAFKSLDWQDNGVPVVKIGSVKPGFVDVEKVSFVSDEIASSKRRYRISPGDILIGMTGAYIGEFGLVPHSENPPLLNQRVGKVTQLEGGFISRFFLYNWMTNSSFKERIKLLSHGSAQENISSEIIQSICLTIPTKDVASAFDLLGQPIIDALLINNSEQKIISGLRDTLLPKLISGEIRIPDAENLRRLGNEF